MNEFQLTAEQCSALAEAEKVVVVARAELGEQYLRYEETRAAHEHATEQLRLSAARARKAEANNRSIMQNLAKVLELPSGEWIYDQATAKLIRRGAPNG